MGSKHTPTKWWKDFDRECAAARIESERKAAHAAKMASWLTELVHRPEFVNGIDRYTLSPPTQEPMITWQSWEEVGAQCYTTEWEPITPNINVYAGMKIIAPCLFGHYNATVCDGLNHAENDETLFQLIHDPIRGLVSASSINKRALECIKLEGDF